MTKQTMKRELEKISQEKGRTELPSVPCPPVQQAGGKGPFREISRYTLAILPF